MSNIRKDRVIARVHELIELGNKIFNVKLPPIDILFDLKGTDAGQAHRIGNNYFLRFNIDLINSEYWDEFYNTTISHEVAHSFCQFNPKLGSNHDAGWQLVVKALGGTGERCHNGKVFHAHGHTYQYTTTTGKKVDVSKVRHERIQAGKIYKYKDGRGIVNNKCEVYIIATDGKELSTPIKVKDAGPSINAANKVPSSTIAWFDKTEEQKVAFGVNVIPTLSKAANSRNIMYYGYQQRRTYEEIIEMMIKMIGYDRALARATFKANAHKVGIPVSFYI